MDGILSLLFIGLIVFLAFKLWNKFKVPKLGAFNFVSGGVKTGKSTLALSMALKCYKQNVRRTWIYNNIFRLFILNKHKREEAKLEEPLLYSNIPLACPYVPITRDLLLRNTRFNYGSIVFIDEASLVADSQLIKDMDINKQLLLFSKLIGHELGPGGKMFLDSQCINDCHYSFKRVMSNYFYVHHCFKVPFLPFLIFKVRELFYSEDNSSTMTTISDDMENQLKTIIVYNRAWKKFDAYCYSVLTDSCVPDTNVIVPYSLKSNDIVSFRNYGVNKDEKK